MYIYDTKDDNDYMSLNYLVFDREKPSKSNQYNRIDHKDMSMHR
jgi:hypothetical protein